MLNITVDFLLKVVSIEAWGKASFIFTELTKNLMEAISLLLAAIL